MIKNISKEQLDKILSIISEDDKKEERVEKTPEDLQKEEDVEIEDFKKLILHLNKMFEFGIDYDKFTETDWYMLGCMFFGNMDKPCEDLFAVIMKMSKAILFANKVIGKMKEE